MMVLILCPLAVNMTFAKRLDPAEAGSLFDTKFYMSENILNGKKKFFANF